MNIFDGAQAFNLLSQEIVHQSWRFAYELVRISSFLAKVIPAILSAAERPVRWSLFTWSKSCAR